MMLPSRSVRNRTSSSRGPGPWPDSRAARSRPARGGRAETVLADIVP